MFFDLDGIFMPSDPMLSKDRKDRDEQILLVVFSTWISLRRTFSACPNGGPGAAEAGCFAATPAGSLHAIRNQHGCDQLQAVRKRSAGYGSHHGGARRRN